jgi:uncharacterized protein involved in exopolysaccharide biosynthesis
MSENIKKQENKFSQVDILSLVVNGAAYVKMKWIQFLIIGLLGAGVGLGYAIYKKPTYTAILTFALEDDKSGGGIGGAIGLASQFGIDLGTSAGGAFNASNLAELIKSRNIIEKALLIPVVVSNKETTLANFYLEFSGLQKKIEENKNLKGILFSPHLNRTKFTIQQDSLLGQIFDKIQDRELTVGQRDRKVSIIDVKIVSKNELFAKLFVESLAKEVSKFYIETKTAKASQNVEIIQHQVDSVKSELSNAISGVASANDNTFNLNPALNVKRTLSQKKQVDVQTSIIMLGELQKNLELAKISLRKETPLIQVIDSPILPLKMEKPSKRNCMIFGYITAITFFSIISIFFQSFGNMNSLVKKEQ